MLFKIQNLLNLDDLNYKPIIKYIYYNQKYNKWSYRDFKLRNRENFLNKIHKNQDETKCRLYIAVTSYIENKDIDSTIKQIKELSKQG